MPETINMETFQGFLSQELADLRAANPRMTQSKAFLLWCTKTVLDVGEPIAKRAIFDRPGERGVDLFYKHEGERKLFIGQAETTNLLDLRHHFNESPVTKLSKALEALNSPHDDDDETLWELSDTYKRATQEGYVVEFDALISGQQGRGLKRESERFSKLIKRRYAKHSLKVLDAHKLKDLYVSRLEGLQPPDVSLKVSDPVPLKYQKDAIIVTVNATEIARVVAKYGFALYQKNARLPLKASPINESILETLSQNVRVSKFWYYNNGLTITCNGFSWSKDHKSLEFDGMQIINGCQTAHTIFVFSKRKRSEENLSDAYVLAKIIKSDDPEFKEEVARYTNWQNAITERDLRSNDMVQLKLQRQFRDFGYFYERKRDEWKNLTAVDQRAYENGMIRNEILAQHALTFWHRMPSQAKMKKKEIWVG